MKLSICNKLTGGVAYYEEVRGKQKFEPVFYEINFTIPKLN